LKRIVRDIERPDKEALDAVRLFSPATLHEAQGRTGAVDFRIKPVDFESRLAGPAVTARCHAGDNLMIFAAIDAAQPGDVLVICGGGLVEQGGFGEVLATACMAAGIAGLVTDASVRDGAAIKRLGFPVFSAGLSVKGTVKETAGVVNHPVVIGGVQVEPGDVVVGDADGVVVVPRAKAADVAKAAAARDDREAEIMESLRAGKSVLDLTGMGATLAAKGCT
jgi:4-hydroxy-4-methyl-2-oxoglutarate aldolase